jgi:FixJ family two-component response regulator
MNEPQLRLDEEVDQVEIPPDGVGWSLAHHSACGQTAFMRPCQLTPGTDKPDLAYPLAPLCATTNEMVFAVDDDPVFRAEIVETLAYFGYPAMACASAAELQSEVSRYQSGCILLDLKLPGEDGLSIQRWLHRAGITLPVVYISATQDIGTIIHCMKSGIVDFLQKPFTEMALRRAVEEAIGLSRKRHCFQQSQHMVKRLLATLTPTELLVARMIARGYVTKQIAAEMQRSENTVKIHRQRIFQKLMINSTASVANLLHHAQEPGLV